MLSSFTRLLSIVLFSTLIFGCSKDRIEEDKKSYESMDSYLDSNKQEEQVFTITENGECPITGKEGTKICGAKASLTPTTDWPYTVKLVELLNPKEMIYYQHSNTNTSGFMTSDGEIRIKAFKDNSELSITTGSSWQVETPNTAPLSSMNIFYGSGSDDEVTWNSSSSGNFVTSSYGYDAQINTFGWISVAKGASTSSTTATFSFTSSTDELDNVVTYIYLSDKKSLTQVHNQTSISLPKGEAATIIMMAIDADNNLFSYSKEVTVDADATYDVELSSISESNLTALLDGL